MKLRALAILLCAILSCFAITATGETAYVNPLGRSDDYGRWILTSPADVYASHDTQSSILSRAGAGTIYAITETWEEHYDPSTRCFERVTVFEYELPVELQNALDANGFAGLPCYRGAMQETILKADKNREPFATVALVALETKGERILIGLRKTEHEAWAVASFGARALLQDRDFSITLSTANRDLDSWFSIQYPHEDGGMETYSINASNTPSFWDVQAYQSVNAQGKGIAILNSYPYYGFRALHLPLPPDIRSEDSGIFYSAYVPLWLMYMNHITDFPTNEEDAMRIAEASWNRFDGSDLAMVYGPVHLREAAAMDSRSLGRVNTGTWIHVLGRENGEGDPWYHARFGEMEGWISGRYVKFPNTGDFSEAMFHLPLTLARAAETCTLRASPDPRAESLMELPKDTRMHVMVEMSGGWLYVTVPDGEIRWEMDMDGIFGYLSADDVVQSSGLSVMGP